MAERKLVVTLSLNDNNYSTKVSNATKKNELMKSSVESLAKTLSSKEARLAEVTKALKTQTSVLETAKAKMDRVIDSSADYLSQNAQLQKAITKQKEKIKDLANAYEEVRVSTNRSGKELSEARALYSAAQRELRFLQADLKESNSKVKEQETLFKQLTTTMSTATKNIDRLEKELEQLNSELESSAVAAAKYKANMEDISKSTESISSGLNAVGGSLTSLGTKLSVASVGLTTGLKKATQTCMDFEKAISVVSATSGATSEEMELLSQKAQSLGKNIKGISSTEAAEALNYLALAGYDVNKMLTDIEPIAKASISWNSDLATTSDLVTDSISAMGETISKAGQAIRDTGVNITDTEYFLDVLSQTSRSANTSAIQLMEAYIECGGTLNNLNVPLEESAKILGVMADNGIKGSQAGNSLNSVLINLMGITSTTEGALSKLGVSVYDAEGNFRGLELVLDEILESASNFSDEISDQTLAMLGGKTQITALQAALKTSKENYDDLEQSIGNSTGALNEMYEVMSSNTSGTWEEAKSTLEALALSFGDILLPAVNSLLNVLMNLANKISGLSDGMKKFIVYGSGIVIALAPLTLLLGQLVISVGAIAGAISSLTAAFAAAGGATAFFTASILPIISVIGTVIAVVVTLAMSIKENWEGIKQATSSLIETCSPAFEKLKDSFSNLWETCKQIYQEIIQPLFRMIGEAIEVCITYATPLLNALLTIFSVVIDGIVLAWNTVGRPVFTSIVYVIELMWSIVKPILVALGELVGAVFNIIMSTYNNILKPVLVGIGTAFQTMYNAVAVAMDKFKSVVTSCMNAVLSPIQWVIDKVKSLVDVFKGVGDKIGSWFGNLFGGSSKSIDVTGRIAYASEYNPALSGSYYNANTLKSREVGNGIVNGAFNARTLMSATSNSNNDFANAIAKILQQNNQQLISAIQNIQLETQDIYLDATRVGRSVSGVVDKAMARNYKKVW